MIDGFLIRHLVAELNNELQKARLEKIIQLSSFSFGLYFYHQGKRKLLIIDLSPEHFRMYLSKKIPQEQLSSQVLSTFKKHLEGAILNSVSQYLSDRVIELNLIMNDFIEGPIQKKLIFEAMGKHSNLLLIQDGIIIDTVKKMFFETGRQLLPQATFTYFPSDKLPFDSIDYQNVETPKELVNRYMGVSPVLASYLDQHKVQVSDIKICPTRDLITGKFYVLDLFSNEKKHYPTISEMLEDEPSKEQTHYQSEAFFIEKQIKKLNNKKEQLSEDLDKAHLGLNAKSIADFIYQSSIPLDQKMASLTYQDGSIITLDPTKTLNQNAQDYYKRYQKSKRSIGFIQDQISQNQEMIQLFQDFQGFLSFASMDSIKELDQELTQYGYKKAKHSQTPKKGKNKPNVLRITDGPIIYTIGKNNLQNEYITHELAQKEDMWFHVKDAPGAHLIVNTSQLTEDILRKAAMLAAYFSSMRESSSIPVDYTKVKHIKKIPGLPGYKVSYKNQQTIYIDIDFEKIQRYLNKV
ncbi:MAG: fibronectin-binding domain-containing protein [Acholeplasma sp.]|jgi:predicted ribosome quality control (RQC) complex YloA/Tae2 family protein|nr:MAG: fibronectin-binding domain-containing protein [Acholeplasma sp.]